MENPKQVKLHDLDVDEFLKDCVTIEPMALEEEFVRLPADLAYWNERYSMANRTFLRAKIDRERTEARLTIQLREELAKTMPEGKKPTVDAVGAAVKDHADMNAARNAEIDAEIEKARLYGVLDAVRAKKDMLVSIGAHHRAEMAGDPRIREEARSHREGKDGGWSNG